MITKECFNPLIDYSLNSPRKRTTLEKIKRYNFKVEDCGLQGKKNDYMQLNLTKANFDIINFQLPHKK